MDQVLLQGMKGFEQRGGKTTRRSQAGAGRDVRHAGNLQVSLLNSYQLQGFPNNRMLDFINRGRLLEMGILQKEPIHETAMNINVDMLVDRRRNQEPTMIAIVGRKVGATAA